MTVTLWICGVLFGLGATFSAIRLVRGPTMIDRAAALDIILATVVGILVLISADTRSPIMLVIAVVVALLGFIGSAGLAKLLPRDRR